VWLQRKSFEALPQLRYPAKKSGHLLISEPLPKEPFGGTITHDSHTAVSRSMTWWSFGMAVLVRGIAIRDCAGLTRKVRYLTIICYLFWLIEMQE